VADRFWVGGTGNITDAANHWAATSGGAPGAGNLPTAADNAIFDANSGANATITVNAAFDCLDFNMGACAATPTLNGSGQIRVSGNVVLKAGMVNSHFGAVTFNATSPTVQTITTNGVAVSQSLQFTGTGTRQLLDDLSISGQFGLQLTAGTFDANGKTVSLNATNLCTITGAFTFFNLTLSAAVKVGSFLFTANITVTGTFKYQGTSAINRPLIQSSVVGTPRTFTVAAIDPGSNFCDFQDIAAAGAAAPFATGSSLGDCGGNTNITTTAPATQTATGTASFTWSTHGWTTRVPLPQDDVIIPNAFVAGRTITADMPRLGKNLTFSCTGAPIFNLSISGSIFGSLVQAAGMTWTLGGNNAANDNFTVAGRGSFTIQSNGVTFGKSLLVNAPGGTYTLLDALALDATSGTDNIRQILVLVNGTFADGNFSIAAGGVGLTTAGAGVRAASIGTGGWSSSGTNPRSLGAAFDASADANLTFSASGQLRFNGTATQTFKGGGRTYNIVWVNNSGGGTFDTTGSNTFSQFKVDAGRSVRFTAGTTNTAADWQFGAGCTIGSITAAGHTLAVSPSSQILVPSPTVSRSTVSPANKLVAIGGTDNGNNSGWVFGSVGAAQGQSAGSTAVLGRTASVIADADFEFAVPRRTTQFRVPLNHRVSP
jgi:hypothetical protein